MNPEDNIIEPETNLAQKIENLYILREPLVRALRHVFADEGRVSEVRDRLEVFNYQQGPLGFTVVFSNPSIEGDSPLIRANHVNETGATNVEIMFTFTETPVIEAPPEGVDLDS